MGPSRSRSGYRPELEGLRGLAILLVLACHAGIVGAEAGFIGVDVFFVLSGFLITGLIVDEHQRTGGIDLGVFYARRARRILPVAAVVLIGTLLAASVVMSPLDMSRVAQDGLAAGVSIANVRFALDSTDYFSPVDPSPMLHYWSLSVEEQFYLFWPALLLIASRAGRPRVAIAAVIAIVLLGSLLASVVVTPASSSLAYFLLPTRAWQLAAGAALALVVGGRIRLPAPVAAVVGWAGAALIAAAVLLIGPTTVYPGIAATVPVAGSIALIAAGNATGSPGRLVLCRAPLRWLGRISYSLYLWHWPVLILGRDLVTAGIVEIPSAADPMVVSLILIAVSVVLAALTWRLIEEPFRAGRLSHGGRRRAIAIAVAAILSVTVASTALSSVAERDVRTATIGDRTVDVVDDLDEGDWPSLIPTPPDANADADESPVIPSEGPRAARSPAPEPTPRPSQKPKPRPEPRLEGPLPSGLRPSLAAARDDEDRSMHDGCALALGGTEPPECTYGDRDGEFTVALVGDSHAMNWFPTIERIAERRHWRLMPFTKYSCVFVDMRLWSDHLKREYTECETWRERVITKLRRLKPDLVVISSNKWFPPIVQRDGEPKRQGAALAAYIERIPGKVAILVDTPRSEHDVPACLARHRAAIERCTTPRATAMGWRHRIREVEARRLSGAPLIDLSKAICPTDPCPAIIGRRIVYRDHHHLTATFAASLARDLDAAITKVLSR